MGYSLVTVHTVLYPSCTHPCAPVVGHSCCPSSMPTQLTLYSTPYKRIQKPTHTYPSAHPCTPIPLIQPAIQPYSHTAIQTAPAYLHLPPSYHSSTHIYQRTTHPRSPPLAPPKWVRVARRIRGLSAHEQAARRWGMGDGKWECGKWGIWLLLLGRGSWGGWGSGDGG